MREQYSSTVRMSIQYDMLIHSTSARLTVDPPIHLHVGKMIKLALTSSPSSIIVDYIKLHNPC